MSKSSELTLIKSYVSIIRSERPSAVLTSSIHQGSRPRGVQPLGPHQFPFNISHRLHNLNNEENNHTMHTSTVTKIA